MEPDILKFKRQVRDWYNKTTNDETTIQAVADTIGYTRKEEHNEKGQ